MVAGSVGLTMFFVGTLAALVTALGNRQWAWAAGILLLAPLAVPYTLKNPKVASWPRSLVLGGLLALVVAAICARLLVPSVFAR
jgi:hypothetical protein